MSRYHVTSAENEETLALLRTPVPLEQVTIDVPETPALPSRAAEFIREGSARIDSFIESHRSLLGFVPSDFAGLYHVLRELRDGCGVAERFCEWGSGFGVVAGLAVMLGYEAWGIEIRPALVRESTCLLADHGLEAEILEGSFIPEEYVRTEDISDGATVTVLAGSGAGDLDVAIDDFDVIFAFPWPGEEEMYGDIFERYAAVGACLVTYHGAEEGILVERKIRVLGD
jgi:hypothetical protein